MKNIKYLIFTRLHEAKVGYVFSKSTCIMSVNTLIDWFIDSVIYYYFITKTTSLNNPFKIILEIYQRTVKIKQEVY